jgi:hypothetical protein
MTVLLFAPRQYRRPLALRIITVSVSFFGLLFLADTVYAFMYLGAWRPNYYMDLGERPRRFNIQDDDLGYRTNPYLRWRGKKNKDAYEVDFRTDENGFRNSKGITRADIVFIGDSYTEAAEVPEEHTFVRRVAQETGLTTVNLAMGGFGPQQELEVLRKYGLSYKPRVVVWQLFGGNDLGDAQTFVKWKNDPNRAFVSATGRYLQNSLINTVLSKTVPERQSPDAVSAYLHLTGGRVEHVNLLYLYVPDEPQLKPLGLSETLKAIDEGHRLCESEGIQLIVLFVPRMVRVFAPYLTFESDADRMRALPGNLSESSEDFESQVIEYCEAIGCPVINLFRELSRAAANDNRNIYLPNDEHFDLRGHEITARSIEASIDLRRSE